MSRKQYCFEFHAALYLASNTHSKTSRKIQNSLMLPKNLRCNWWDIKFA